MPWCTDTSQSCISFIVSKDTWGEFFVQHHDTFGLPILRQVVGFPRNFLQYGVKPENRKNRNPASHGVLDNSHLHLVPRILVPQGVAQENQWRAGEVWRFFSPMICHDLPERCIMCRPDNAWVPKACSCGFKASMAIWDIVGSNLLADKSQGRWSWEPNLKPKVVGDKDCLGTAGLLDEWMNQNKTGKGEQNQPRNDGMNPGIKRKITKGRKKWWSGTPTQRIQHVTFSLLINKQPRQQDISRKVLAGRGYVVVPTRVYIYIYLPTLIPQKSTECSYPWYPCKVCLPTFGWFLW